MMRGRHPFWACVGAAWMVLALGTAGCEKKETGPRSTTQTAGAAPMELLKEAGLKPVFVAVKAAARPKGPLAKDASCVTPACHSTYATAAHIHGPVAARACDSCHADDIGDHRYPLKRNTTDTCTFCHTVSGTAKHQHGALQQGCVSCHRPHESNAKFLLKTDTVESLCATCHDVPLKKYAHGPFAKGQCTLCHQAHQADNAKLLRGGEGSQHCFMCHSDMKQTMATAAHTHKPAAEKCVTCHNPHASEYPHELRRPIDETCLGCHEKVKGQMAGAKVAHGAMTTGRKCANCHDAHASGQPQMLRQRMDKVCLACHDRAVKASDGHVIGDMKPVLSDSKYLHGPVKAGDCSACHGAHGAAEPNLLVRTFPKTFYTSFSEEKYALCFGCHEKQLVLTAKTGSLTNFRNGDTNLHYVHVHRDEKGRSCRTCHAVHGSDLPRHMAGEVPFEGSNWSMPIVYEPTSDGGRCAPGCHTPREYGRGQPATRPTTGGVK